jgi:hypothetical protein
MNGFSRLTAQLGLALLVVLFTAGLAISQTILARTESGREVILSPDGTWKYATKVSIAEPPEPAVVRRGISNDVVFKSTLGGFGLRYDSTKWLKRPDGDDPGRTQFKLKRGDAYAVMVVEEIGLSLENLKSIALENAKAAAPDAHFVSDEVRTINGKEVMFLTIDGTIKEIPFRYYGCYYGSKSGTVQLLTYTAQSLFTKYEQDFKELLAGFEIY